MLGWYEATDARRSAGEANVPALSVLQGFILGRGIRNIVQLGHYEGFSTLLFGFMMRRMGHKNSVFTVDIDANVSEFTRDWVDRAGLSDYVRVVTASSDAPHLPAEALEYFGERMRSLFIDSLHHYRHTMSELRIWWPWLSPFGLVFAHDVSLHAATESDDSEGGSGRALTEWARETRAAHILVNGHFRPGNPLVYLDPCGLAIMQKP